MPILDPKEFWGKDSEIATKMTTESVFRRRFSYPQLKDKNGNYIFRIVVDAISKVAKDNFIKGYIDLDSEWTSNPQLETYRKQLYEKNPKPFNGYRLYFGRIQIKEIEEDVEDPITKKKEKKKRIGIADKVGNGHKLQLQICIFRNLELGWTPEWEQPPKITTKRVNPQTGAMETIEEEPNPDDVENFKPTWKWKGVSGFISLELFTRLEGFVEQCYKKGDQLPKELSVLVVGSKITTEGKFFNMDIGDVL